MPSPSGRPDLRAIEAVLPRMFAGRYVLEIACGTGWWTPHGARRAAGWLATDLNPETIEIARHKTLPASVRFALAGRLRAPTRSTAGRSTAPSQDSGGATCRARGCPAGWRPLHARLAPGARVVFVDNRYVEGSSTPIARTDAAADTCSDARSTTARGTRC